MANTGAVAFARGAAAAAAPARRATPARSATAAAAAADVNNADAFTAITSKDTKARDVARHHERDRRPQEEATRSASEDQPITHKVPGKAARLRSDNGIAAIVPNKGTNARVMRACLIERGFGCKFGDSHLYTYPLWDAAQ